jgi:hypothetical protein
MNDSIENIIKLFDALGINELGVPDELQNEYSEEELLYDWDGGILDENQ